jgi:hypothetical protein
LSKKHAQRDDQRDHYRGYGHGHTMVDKRSYNLAAAAVDQQEIRAKGMPKESMTRLITREQLGLRPATKHTLRA